MSLELRDNIQKILKEVDKYKNNYLTATMVAVIKGFELGYKRGKQKY